MECQALWCNVVLNICSIILMVKTLSKIIKQSWKSSISKKCWRTGKIIRQTTSAINCFNTVKGYKKRTKTHKSYKIRKQKKSARTDVTSSIQPRRLKLLLSLRSFYMYLYCVTNMILNSLHALNQYGFCILSKSSFIKRWQYSFSCYLKDVKLYKSVLLHLSYGFIFTAQYCFQ